MFYSLLFASSAGQSNRISARYRSGGFPLLKERKRKLFGTLQSRHTCRLMSAILSLNIVLLLILFSSTLKNLLLTINVIWFGKLYTNRYPLNGFKKTDVKWVTNSHQEHFFFKVVSQNIRMVETDWRVKMVSKVVLIDQGQKTLEFQLALRTSTSQIFLALGKS